MKPLTLTAMAVCGGCGKFGRDDARFCSACSSSLAAVPSFDRRARKTLTVVFADIAGSTELGGRLDAETVRHVIAQYFRTTPRVLERHGGTSRIIVDAVMAVFGIPVVHEDDALEQRSRGCLRCLGEVLHKRGRPEEAETAVREALALYEAREHRRGGGGLCPAGRARTRVNRSSSGGTYEP
jgi:class 3 adenylate cyclase